MPLTQRARPLGSGPGSGEQEAPPGRGRGAPEQEVW